MLAESFALMPLWVFLVACSVTLAAGFVKGAIGFAQPLVMMSGMSLVMDPLLAIAGLILPTTLANVMQALRYGPRDAWDAAREYWRYIVIVCVMIMIVTQFVASIPTQTFYLVLGIPVMGLSVIQLFGFRFSIAAQWRRVAEWGIGTVAGILGGITGTWGPPTVLYLMALDVPKAKMIIVQGVVYGLGSISLLGGHVASGVLNATTAPFSAVLMIPAVLGIRVGVAFGNRLDPEVFRRFILIVLVVAGANLLRRGIFG